jgi:small subunit ribosomal protein S17
MDTKKKKIIKGKIVSDKMDKTRIVEVSRKNKLPLYSKIVNRRTKYMAHDSNNETRMGDIVEISYLRPLSSKKSWEIIKIIEKASI